MSYSAKIQRLHDRRKGLYSSEGVYDSVAAFSEAATLRKREKYKNLSEPESVKYAIGSMQRVDDEYTRNSYIEGNRVRDCLSEGLTTVKIPVTFEYQGSVPLDVHVRGNSDIDLLVLHDGFITVEPSAKQQYHYDYSDYNGKSPVEELQSLRNESIKILERRYYAAKVDSSGSKSICLSGGSLKRKVDVVPSHWHDTLFWKITSDIRHREVYILDNHKAERNNNKPFMHIKTVEEKCISAKGNLRKIVRLLKNLKYDAEPLIKLSSYDITGIAWHMTEQELAIPFGMDLLLLDRALKHLLFIINNEYYRKALKVPDGSRLIYDTPDKLIETSRLYRELEQLSRDVYKDLSPLAFLYDLPAAQVLAKAINL